MTNCLAESDFRELGDTVLSEFDKRVSEIPKDLCAPFHEEARQLETQILMIYRIVAMHVRKEQDIAKIASAWKFMVQVCDAFAFRLNGLSKQHPYCGADSYYDRVLDLRNKCQRLHQMHT